jgi:hypothetical protein
LLVRQGESVRSLAFLCLLGCCFTTSRAQNQERSLVDRLLRPNIDLQNNAQGKTFSADSKVVERRGNLGTFFVKPAGKQKSFVDTRAVATKEYPSRSFQTGSRMSFSTREANLPGQLTTSSARGIRAAYDARVEVSGRSFADKRAFREEGKRQKSLDRQNPPLTIDQVRELLNKNK